MKKVIFDKVEGDIRTKVEISDVPGAAGALHLYIGGRYWGQFSKRAGKWAFLPQKDEDFSMDDSQILTQIAEDNFD